MKWNKFRKSKNIEDVRGKTSRSGFRMSRGFGRGTGGRRLRLPRGRGGKVSILGIVVMLGIAWLLGINPLNLLMGGDNGQLPLQNNNFRHASTSDETKKIEFIAAVLGSTEDVWHKIFSEMGRRYNAPKLQVFKGVTTQNACGQQSSASGPFYCPPEHKIFIDLAFFNTMSEEFGVSGEFAQAYVIAHEVGHHVQNSLGISGKVQQQKSRLSKVAANKLSVKLELQADCFAGVWAKRAEDDVGFLEPGDVQAAIKAATAIGDDNLQKRSLGYIIPESFTHGTSKQRVFWFNKGLMSGDINNCNSFN